MAKKINILGNNVPVANQGLKLSKLIPIKKIEKLDAFQNLNRIDEDVLERIADNMSQNQFDNSQPVHLWKVIDDDGTEHLYLIDGYTRIEAAEKAGILVVPYFEHDFATEEEAMLYAIHLQVDRRNCTGMDLIKKIEKLKGSDYIQSQQNKNSQIAEILGMSKRTVERAAFVAENASDEQLAKIEAGEETINATYNDIKETKLIDEEATDEQKEMLESGEITKEEVVDEIKSKKSAKKSNKKKSEDEEESGSEHEGEPMTLNFTHSDGIERPYRSPSEEDETDEWIKEKKLQVESARKEGFSDGFYNGLVFALSEIARGRTVTEVWNDERVSDLSADIICDFEQADDAEKIIEEHAK